MLYELKITNPVIKYLEKLPADIYRRLKEAILNLENNQGHLAAKKCWVKMLTEYGLEIIELFTLSRIKFYW